MVGIIDQRVFRALKKVMLHWGFTNIEATIYSLLLLENKTMSAIEIAKETGYAYSSVINALNGLKRFQLIEREKKGKCYYFTPVSNIVEIIRNERKAVRNYLIELRGALKEEGKKYSELLRRVEEGIEYLGEAEGGVV
ncbi:MAG: transcriptional regulator [Thermoplasmata archaeon]|nr:transcriptional regulator [Thermoplasmata archaeon]